MARNKPKNIYLKSKEFRKYYEEIQELKRPCEETLSAQVNFICWLLDEIDGHNNGFRSCVVKGHYNKYQDNEYYPLE